MMETETTLLLDLDERNLAHFLSALALAALAQRVRLEHSTTSTIESRRCWWPKPEEFAIQTELPAEQFRPLLFTTAHDFLAAMKWHPGLGGSEQGILSSGREIGVNPFASLSGEAGENSVLKVFSGNETPGTRLKEQQRCLAPSSTGNDWLAHLARGKCRWGFDCRVRMHASDTGYSPDAEGTGDSNPFYPAIELLSLAAAAFFAPAQAWQTARNALHASAWAEPLPLPMAGSAATGRIRGLIVRPYRFAYRPAAHGDGGKYRFFPPATIQLSTP